MRSIRQKAGGRRLTAGIATALLALAATVGCTGAKANGGDQKQMDAITQNIQSELAQKPGVVTAKVGYQNNVDASERADVNLALKPGTDPQPVIDDAVRLVWQSKLNPLSSINVGVVFDQSNQRGMTKRVNILNRNEKAEMESKYGQRPR